MGGAGQGACGPAGLTEEAWAQTAASALASLARKPYMLSQSCPML